MNNSITSGECLKDLGMWGWLTVQFAALCSYQPSLFWSRSHIWGDHCLHIAVYGGVPLADKQLNLATVLQYIHLRMILSYLNPIERDI